MTRLMGFVDMGGVFRFFAPVLSHGVDNVQRLHAAGASLATGNDAGAIPCTPAMIGLELELFRLEEIFSTKDALIGLRSLGKGRPELKGS
jgi:hypothetical protein